MGSEPRKPTGDGMVHAWGVYCPGVAGMARGEAQDSANSQFFLMRQAYPSLDKRYTAWGRVISGLDVVRAIKTGEEPSGAVAAPQDVMTSVRVAADIPVAERPVARVLNTGSPTFTAMIEQTRAAEACIGAQRADLVLAGAAILEAVQRAWPCARVRVADRGLREGLLLTAMREGRRTGGRRRRRR